MNDDFVERHLLSTIKLIFIMHFTQFCLNVVVFEEGCQLKLLLHAQQTENPHVYMPHNLTLFKFTIPEPKAGVMTCVDAIFAMIYCNCICNAIL